jgi:hypothetical protein
MLGAKNKPTRRANLKFVIFPTTTFFYIHTTEIIARSSRSAAKGQSKGENVSFGVSPPPPSSFVIVTPPCTTSGAPIATNNPAAARKQAKENKYLLWKHVTRNHEPTTNIVGGGNVAWTCNSAVTNSRAPATTLWAICSPSQIDKLEHVKWCL